MPYIDEEDRKDLQPELFDLVDKMFFSVDDLQRAAQINYDFTYLLDRLYNGSKNSYRQFNEQLGILEAVKLELYRRRIAPYEDKKIEENGDVY